MRLVNLGVESTEYESQMFSIELSAFHMAAKFKVEVLGGSFRHLFYGNKGGGGLFLMRQSNEEEVIIKGIDVENVTNGQIVLENR